MALKCPKCGSKSPRGTPRCPNCGELFKSHGCAIAMGIFFALIALLLVLLLVHKYKMRASFDFSGLLSAPAYAQEEAPERYPAGPGRVLHSQV